MYHNYKIKQAACFQVFSGSAKVTIKKKTVDKK